MPDTVRVRPEGLGVTPDIAALRIQARAALHAGDLGQARTLHAELLAAQARAGAPNADDLMHSALVEFNDGRMDAALKFMSRARTLRPDDPLIPWNLTQILVVAGRYAPALEQAEAAMRVAPDYPEAHAVLARIHGALGNLDETRRHGEMALLNADRRARGRAFPIPAGPPKTFDANTPARNVIAFTLWGDAPRYRDNALANARLAPRIYPEWRLRFYCEGDSVPGDTQRALRDLGCEVVVMTRQKRVYEGLFWRMLVLSDKGLDRFMLRDADSLFSARERAAVDAWLESERYFHVMRDHAMQTDLIQAGLWGGVAGVLPPLQELLDTFALRQAPTRMVDQQFLGAIVWPTVRQSVLVHDSLYTCFGARPYPAGEAPPGGYLGAPVL
jgi:tetratricopeptide (TPR) repeat protein